MSKEKRLRILLDTSFILPTLGIDVNERVINAIRELKQREAEIFFSRFSLLESLWVAAKLIKTRKFDYRRFLTGLESLFKAGRYKLISEGPDTFMKAIELYRLGHEDMIDNILYATSIEHNLNFLTLDEELKEFIKRNRLRDTLILP